MYMPNSIHPFAQPGCSGLFGMGFEVRQLL